PAVSVLLAPTRALLGVRFIVLPPRAASAEPALRAVYDGADARIFEDPTALPRAFVVSRARCADDREALALLRARAIGADEVVLADCAAPAAGETDPIASRGVAPDSRSVVAPGPRSAVAPQVRMLIDDPARGASSARCSSHGAARRLCSPPCSRSRRRPRRPRSPRRRSR